MKARPFLFELTPDKKRIFDNALILISKGLHDKLDAPVPAAKLARSFKQGKKCEARVAATLASLTRTGFIASTKDSTAFAIRRAG